MNQDKKSKRVLGCSQRLASSKVQDWPASIKEYYGARDFEAFEACRNELKFSENEPVKL